MECLICLDDIKISCAPTCMHHFCYGCIIKWCHTSNQCPKCRQPIRSIHLDPEFDSLMGSSSETIGDAIAPCPSVIIDLSVNSNVGITLGNARHSPGVTVERLNTKMQAHKCGLRKGDIILTMNNVPCHEHQSTIKMVNACQISRHNIACRLLGK